MRELDAPVSASEDFGSFGTEWGVPSVFWYVGGTDPEAYHAAERAGRVAQDIPTNHNPTFAPVIHPTLETGRSGDDGSRARRPELRRWRYPSASASHTMPTAMSPMGTRRVRVAASPKKTMPATAAPTAPVPVHTA